jgi:hypothetical protein
VSHVATEIGSTFFNFWLNDITDVSKKCFKRHNWRWLTQTYGNRGFRIFSSSPWSFWSKDHNHACIENLGLWPDWRVGQRRRWPWIIYTKHFWCWDLSNEPSHVHFWTKELMLYSEKREGQGLGPNPGLLGHGSKIQDRTIAPHPPTDIFKISALYVLYRLRNRAQTDGRTNDIKTFFKNVL